jgi:hypothetical protein
VPDILYSGGIIMSDKRIEYLLNLMDNKTTLKKLSGYNKKAYQYILCGIFINIINGHNDKYFQYDLYYKAEEIINFKGKLPLEYVVPIISAVQTSMHNNFIRSSEDPETPKNIIAFFRNKLKDLKNGKSLSQAIEYEEIMDIKGFMKQRGVPYLQGHHWLDFNLENGLTHTTPVFILLNDLKAQWNNYIDLDKKFYELVDKFRDNIDFFEFINIKEVAELRLAINALYRTMIFTAVTFVEAYLLEVFLNIKMSFSDEDGVIKALENDDNITDKEIVQRVIYKLFPDIKGKVHHLYKEYKKILDYRDRYVHASAFKEEHSNLSKLQYLLDFNENMVMKNLTTCISLIKNIDDNLPNEIKSLYWWERLPHIDFSKKEKISLLSLKKPRKSLSDYI